MKKLIDRAGAVHFDGPANGRTLCGVAQGERDLFGDADGASTMRVTSRRVTCPRCAAAYVAIKNMQFGAVEPGVLTDAVYEWGGVRRAKA